jgi:hypothetical protein
MKIEHQINILILQTDFQLEINSNKIILNENKLNPL